MLTRLCPAAVLSLILLMEALASADWPMWGGSPSRNNVSPASVPKSWNVGKFDARTGEWQPEEARSIKWTARLGSQSYGNPVVSGGRVFVGTNNAAGYLQRYPDNVDLGCLLCFRESDGSFLWQYSAEKLPTGRVHDWPEQGICSAPLVAGNRMWFVDNRGRVVCLDTEGFHDGENDGEVVTESARLFSFVPGIPAGYKPRYGPSHLNDRLAVSELLASHGVADFRCGWLTKDDAGNGWLATTNTGGQKTDYRLVVGDTDISVFRADETGRPLFVARRTSLQQLQESKVSARIRAQLERAGVSLPEDVQVTTVEPGTEWSVSFATDKGGRTIQLQLQGFILSGYELLSPSDKDEADVVWRLDMMKELGVRQHNMATCAPVAWGDTLFVCTSNGVDEAHVEVPAPDAPSFIAIDKHSGKVLWQDRSPGRNILHGQWSAAAVGEFDGVPQVIFPAGDGWIYSFRADDWNREQGTPILLWKFDSNPKDSRWILGGTGTRNNAIAIPVIYDGRVYVSCGQDPEHGEGGGHLWCLDPTRRGDVSAELAMRVVDGKPVPIPHRRVQAVSKEQGEVAVENPNSAVVWHYAGADRNGDGRLDFEETFHRTLSSPAIQNDLLFIPDISGLVHCLDAKSGAVHWTCDMLAAVWGSPLIAGDQVYIGDEDGDLAVFQLSPDPTLSTQVKAYRGHSGKTSIITEPRHQNLMNSSVHTSPIAANGVLYISDRSHLYAIQANDPGT